MDHVYVQCTSCKFDMISCSWSALAALPLALAGHAGHEASPLQQPFWRQVKVVS